MKNKSTELTQNPPFFKTDVIDNSFDWDKFANALKDEFGESLVDDGSEEDAYNWWLTDVTVTDIIEFIKNWVLITNPTSKTTFIK